jgi:uncharacterized protein
VLVRFFGWAASVAIACMFGMPALAFDIPPTPTHYVTDTANAMSPSARDTVDAQLRAYEKSSGHQVIVWIGQTTGGETLETYTSEVAHQWKVGRKGKDDGVVLFFFMQDHKVRIEVGYGFEGTLTDATSKAIVDNDIVPRMRAGDVDGAIHGGVDGILNAIEVGGSGQATSAPTTSPGALIAGPIVAIVVFVLFAAFWLCFCGFLIFAIARSARRGGAGGVSGGWISSGSSSSSDSFSSSSSSSSSDDDFSSGGGDFGGGGASGSW